MRAYLDYNIITSIEDRHFDISKILKINPDIAELPYSSAHIHEVNNITGEEVARNKFIDTRLETIRSISKLNYFYYDLKLQETVHLIQDPAVVFKTINEVGFAKPAMQMFVNLLSSSQKTDIRNAFGIDSKRLNNYSPNEVVNQLNISLDKREPQNTFLKMIDDSIAFFPDSSSFGLHNKFAAIYELLDLFGYWKDRETNTSNYARLWDSLHAYFAAHCDYFISDDKRNRNKARVVYSIYNINTKVVDSNGND